MGPREGVRCTTATGYVVGTAATAGQELQGGTRYPALIVPAGKNATATCRLDGKVMTPLGLVSLTAREGGGWIKTIGDVPAEKAPPAEVRFTWGTAFIARGP